MTTRLALITELYTEAPAAQRCPHLVAPDAEGCRCRQLDGDASRAVCDHFSLQLWCLAGPERWPICVYFADASLTAAAGLPALTREERSQVYAEVKRHLQASQAHAPSRPPATEDEIRLSQMD